MEISKDLPKIRQKIFVETIPMYLYNRTIQNQDTRVIFNETLNKKRD
jgi:hypothetical protein